MDILHNYLLKILHCDGDVPIKNVKKKWTLIQNVRDFIYFSFQMNNDDDIAEGDCRQGI